MAFLRTEGISKKFGGLKALNDVSIEAEVGKITGLIGPNGAGKTTLFNAMSGYVTPDSGSVIFDGMTITKFPPWKIVRTGLSRTFQTPSGFGSMDVWENLMLAGSDDRVESPIRALFGCAEARSDQLDLSDQAVALLKRLEILDNVDMPLHMLSMADLRFVEIARQLMGKPKMLMLDEPAAGFGPDKIDKLGAMIRWLRDEGTTILLIEHNLSFVLELAEYVYVLANGAVIAEGTPDEVSKDQSVIQNYIGAGHGAA
ncbi:MAG: ABC transporter ATP-binding protein [Paracoccaceae bacterium]|nr:ABC transporter ATP-binding protein [Paracoccaceae bacterium]